MKEELEKEKVRLEAAIKLHDDRHQESLKIANVFRKQLKGIERAISAYADPTAGETLKEVAEGLK